MGHAATSRVHSLALESHRSTARASHSREASTQLEDLSVSGHLRCSYLDVCGKTLCDGLWRTSSRPYDNIAGSLPDSWETHLLSSFYWSNDNETWVKIPWKGPWTDWIREGTKCRSWDYREHSQHQSPGQHPTHAPSTTQWIAKYSQSRQSGSRCSEKWRTWGSTGNCSCPRTSPAKCSGDRIRSRSCYRGCNGLT